MARQKITNFCLTIYHLTKNNVRDVINVAPECPKKLLLASVHFKTFSAKSDTCNLAYFLLILFMNHFPVRGQEGQVL